MQECLEKIKWTMTAVITNLISTKNLSKLYLNILLFPSFFTNYVDMKLRIWFLVISFYEKVSTMILHRLFIH